MYNLNEKLKTKDKNLFERWKNERLDYVSLEPYLESKYAYNFIVASYNKDYNTPPKEIIIFKTKISHIEKFLFFEEKQQSHNHIECIYLDEDDFVVSEFWWSDVTPTNEEIVEKSKNGPVFLQTSECLGHSDYLEDHYLTESSLRKYIRERYHIQHDIKKAKKSFAKKILYGYIKDNIKHIQLNNAIVNVSFILNKRDIKKIKRKKLFTKMRIAKVRFNVKMSQLDNIVV